MINMKLFYCVLLQFIGIISAVCVVYYSPFENIGNVLWIIGVMICGGLSFACLEEQHRRS